MYLLMICCGTFCDCNLDMIRSRVDISNSVMCGILNFCDFRLFRMYLNDSSYCDFVVVVLLPSSSPVTFTCNFKSTFFKLEKIINFRKQMHITYNLFFIVYSIKGKTIMNSFAMAYKF